jgi:D-beta-D-heptose 7-phosphate kinase/D-beta-D-heptose 1-phosphate adenosyltransferase
MIDAVGRLMPKPIFVFGDVMLDAYVCGQVNRLSPEAPVPILKIDETWFAPGGAANVATQCANLGCKVQLLGAVGDDLAGQMLHELLPDGAPSWHIQPNYKTTLKTRALCGKRPLLRIDQESQLALDESTRTQLRGAINSMVHEFAAVVIVDHGKGMCHPNLVDYLIATAQRFEIPIIVDPTPHATFKYTNATVLTPNVEELRAMAQVWSWDDPVPSAANYLLGLHGVFNVAVTDGANGIILAINGGETHWIPTQPVEEVDVMGAGDAVAATLAVALANKIDIVTACRLANLAGRAVVQQHGAGVVTKAHLFDNMLIGDNMSAIVRAHEVNKCTRVGAELIVFTNGCFDMLHPGHVALIRHAASLGDKLIVGLNSDRSVRARKGSGRPVVSETQRARQIMALDCVHHVVIFDTEEELLNQISIIKPDVLVKGSDYTPETVVGADIVDENGGRIVIFPRIPNHSTTALLKAGPHHGYVYDGNSPRIG